MINFPSHLVAFQSYIKTRGQGSRQYKENRGQQTDSYPPQEWLFSWLSQNAAQLTDMPVI